MAPSPTDISSALQNIPEKREFLRKAFGDLEEQKALIARCSGGWKELDTHLSEIQDALEKRYAEIVDKEVKFEARTKELQDALDKRESVIESREQASLARVQEQKDAAIAAIREQKRKWIEEKQLMQSQSPAKPDPDCAGSKAKQKDSKVQKDEEGKPKSSGDGVNGKEKEASLRDKDDTGVKKNSKEMASAKSHQKEGTNSQLKKVKENSSTSPQKKGDTSKSDGVVGSADVSISKPGEEKERKLGAEVATDNKQETVLEEKMEGKQVSAEENSDDLEDRPEAMEIGDEDAVKSGDEDGSDEDDKEGSHKKVGSSQSAIKVRPELTSFCEKMDGSGLYSFLILEKKSLKFIRKELPIAMKCASDPSQLVLQAVKDHQSSESGSESAQGKKLASRRSCITVLESFAVFLDGKEKTGNGLSDEVKGEAKKVAELWKSKLNPKASDQSAQLDAHSFLQLVATFGLASDFSEDELCDLVVPICFRKQIPKLCRKLGLAHKASELVDRLIKDGRQVDAVSFIQEYHLAKKFEPISVLKSCLKDIRKGHGFSSTAEEKDELHMKELMAAKAILKCVEKYRFEKDYPVERLQRRIAQLEKVSSEKKRNSDANTGGAKKARPNGPGGPSRPSDRFGGRGMGGHTYGLPFGRGGRGGYPFPAGGLAGYPSSYSHGNYPYGAGPPSYQGPYLR